ncbi:MAG: GtrA family protein [Halobacteriota archaeon]
MSALGAPRIQQIARFACVGASGVLLTLALTWGLTEYVGVFYLLSAALAMEISIFWSFALNTTFTFHQTFTRLGSLFSAVGKYQLAGVGGLIINLALLFAFTELFNVFYIVSEFVAIIIAFGFRYLMSLRFVWKG